MTTPESKTCTKCGENKPLSDYYKQAGCRDGRRPDCKECVKARARQWGVSNRDKQRAKNQQPARKAAATVRARAHYKANRENRKRQALAYSKANPEVGQRARAKRRARIMGVEHQPYTRREIYDRDEGTCKRCRIALPFGPGTFHIDHILPISLGGPDTPANVQLMCAPCNREKWANVEGQIHFAV